MNAQKRPILLTILDGWGYSENTEGNAIANAKKPVWDGLFANNPHTLINASGPSVGLPSGQMGNSEVGHLNLGAGRVVYQEFTRIERAIETGQFFSNKTLTDAVDMAIEKESAVHIFGLMSPGGVHSHEAHIQAMVKLAVERGVKQVFVHAFLDGRDTAPKSAASSISAMKAAMIECGGGQIATIIGRFYAMDRDYRWDRVQAAYDLFTQGKAEYRAVDPSTALEMAYERGETDEFVQATVIAEEGAEPHCIKDDDVVVFMNFRSDRARQLTRAFIAEDFDGFVREVTPKLGLFCSLAEYNKDFYYVPVAFPPERYNNVFGEYISKLGLKQLRIAETEKYAHVTFFFNGGAEAAYPGEDRVLVQSPKVKTYDMQPEMSAGELTDRLVAAIESGEYDTIICNYANPDMVGHTGKLDAAIEAIEALDSCLGRVEKAIKKADGEWLITADHGNAEQMFDPATGQPHTAHTSNLVPFIYVGRSAEIAEDGALCDVTPTMLHLLGLEKPAEMTGASLVTLQQ
ncbi:MAG: phosphoglycerate mutase (2,3-diphosphoglycerate-independent) [Gammaproteobacteria bacterium]|nr:MAG: phosphoglycerate mutase (2,3-diphosphoglycerate-independent) [Gammaproteobacteria bacterium]